MNSVKNLINKEVFGTARLNMRLPNADVLLGADFKGEILETELKSSLYKASKKHLLLRSIINIDEENKASFVIEDVFKPDIRILTEDDIQQVRIEALREPFDIENGPLIRFYLYSSKSKSKLLICCHHAICDGLSLIYLLQDIIESIINEDKEIENSNSLMVLDKHKIPEGIKNNFLVKLIVRSINKKINKRTVEFSDTVYREIHEEFWSKHNNEIHSWKLSVDDTKRLIKKAKENNVSVNSAIVTLFLLAEKKVLERQSYSKDMTISVNIRKYMQQSPGETMGFYASAVRPKLEYSNGKGFWENVKAVNKKIKGLITEKNLFESQIIGLFNPKFIDALALGKFNRTDEPNAIKMVRKKKMNVISTSCTFANLGKIDFTFKKDKLMLDSIYGPIVYGDTMEKYIGIITLNDKIHFSISYNLDVIRKDQIEEIEKIINKEIQRI